MRDFVTILGATGYTGRLCAAEAARIDLPVRLAGRRADALHELAAETGALEIAVVDAADGPALETLARSSSVVVTTVGPYLDLGKPVVEAALAGGCHYLDVSAEVPFLEWVHEQGARAVEAGVALCPGFGFDGGPGDLLAALAAERLEGAVAEARVAYLIRAGRVSAGTARSALGVLRHGGAAWVDGALRAEPAAAHRWTVPFPGALGARGAVSAPMPEVVALGRSLGARTARAYFVLPLSAVVPVAARPLDVLGSAIARTPLLPALQRASTRLPAGPSPQRRARTRTAVLAEVRGGGRTARTWGRCSDLYQVTARIAMAAAARLARGEGPGVGAFTPAQAIADRGAFLEEVGVTWEHL